MNPTVIIFRWKSNRMQAKTTSYRINCGREEVEVKVEESVIIPQVIYAKKDEYITTAYQSIKDKPQDIPDTEDPELDARVSEVSDMMDSALASSGDSEGSAALFDVNGSPSDTHCEATDLDFVLQGRDMDWYNEPDDSNSYTTSQEFMQDDKLKVGNEITNYEVQNLSINKLSSDATDLAIDKISRNQLEYSDSVKSDGHSAPDFIRLHGSPRWHKNMSAAKNSERKREVSSTNRSRWH